MRMSVRLLCCCVVMQMKRWRVCVVFTSRLMFTEKGRCIHWRHLFSSGWIFHHFHLNLLGFVQSNPNILFLHLCTFKMCLLCVFFVEHFRIAMECFSSLVSPQFGLTAAVSLLELYPNTSELRSMTEPVKVKITTLPLFPESSDSNELETIAFLLNEASFFLFLWNDGISTIPRLALAQMWIFSDTNQNCFWTI